MMMHRGLADGMVSGACHTTADTMRPALQIIKTAPGFSLVSSVFFMLLPKQVYVYGDCAINVDPNAEQLGNIAASSALTAQAFGIEPRVAMLSYATGDSNKGDLITKVKDATDLALTLVPESVHIEGPMQFDAAVDPEVAKVKVKTASNVAGKATVCVFPDLNTGNNTYKAVQQASGCIAMGPIMQGLRKPVNDLSRGCTVDDIVNTCVITCIQAIGAAAQN
jgi:phosphate acetyltransferase